MRHIPLLLIFTLCCACGQRAKKETASTTQSTVSILATADRVEQVPEDDAPSSADLLVRSMEDTVRYQLGGELFHLGNAFDPSDSITVIRSIYYPDKYVGLYREYEYIVHNRRSWTHHQIRVSRLDSLRRDELETALEMWRIDSIPSRHIDPSIADFNDHWFYLKEYEGEFYLTLSWSCYVNYFVIADSIYYTTCHEVIPHRIVEAVTLPDGGISILLHNYDNPFTIEPFDAERGIYKRNTLSYGVAFVAPARAIHNFEIITYANNDLCEGTLD